jgi:ABC-2 type transport system ATP-binding protein
MSLEIRALALRYPGARTRALDGVDLSIRPGRVTALLGPNGAGKTSLASVVMGLVTPDTGSVEIGGDDLLGPRAAAARRRIGFAPQEEALFPTLTVRDNFQVFAELAGLRGSAAQARISAVADAFLVGDLLGRTCGQLSGGQRRRIHNAIALLGRPAVVILDEPTAGIDPATRGAILDVVRTLVNDGTGVWYSTHYLPEVEALDADVTIVSHGRVVATGTVDSLIAAHSISVVRLGFDGPVPDAAFPGVVERGDREVRIQLEQPARHLPAIMAALGPDADRLCDVEISTASLDDVFARLTGEHPSDVGDIHGAP